MDDTDHQDFNPEGIWPRRLLNVLTMTSWKWEPGDTYGGFSNPPYSVLSYTWGRWRLPEQDTAFATTTFLPVQQVPWDIPRISPAHFTSQHFVSVLNAIVDHSGHPFVWVDVACIPQFATSAVADSEIGRQARIFRGTDKGYIWLTDALATQYEYHAKAYLDEKAVKSCMGLTPTPVWKAHQEGRDRAREMGSLCHLLQDPSFSSMWTLQESFVLLGHKYRTSTTGPYLVGSSIPGGQELLP